MTTYLLRPVGLMIRPTSTTSEPSAITSPVSNRRVSGPFVTQSRTSASISARPSDDRLPGRQQPGVVRVVRREPLSVLLREGAGHASVDGVEFVADRHACLL